MGKRVFDPASGRMVDENTSRLVDAAGSPVSSGPMYSGPQVCDPVIGNDGDDAVMRGDPRVATLDRPEEAVDVEYEE